MSAIPKLPRFYEGRYLRENPYRLLALAFLAVGAGIILTPVLWMFFTSVKSMGEIMSGQATFFPRQFHPRNYVETWQKASFTRYTFNTVFITTCVVIGSVFSNTLVAYGFAKLRFRLRGVLFALVLSTMMIPPFVLLIPQYILFSRLGWVNTYLPLIVPAFFGNAFFIFLLRQFFLTIPNEVIDAAKVDGASHFRIWWSIMMPLAKPAIIVVAVFSFQWTWNDFVGPLVYLSDTSLFTLQLGLQAFQGQVQTQWNYLMAGSLIVLLPVIVLFVVAQRHFIEGMNLTAGIKG